MSNQIICIDWGTSNFRAFLVDVTSGECLDKRASDQGLLSLQSHQFADYCQSQVGHWRKDALTTIYLSGMVGSDRGWATAPQLDLPVSGQTLANELIAAPGMENCWLIPGVKIVQDSHVDVMRGEEVQALGALKLMNAATAVCCLPGTHSKWVQVSNSQLEQFTTLITGELYQSVCQHTLMGKPAQLDAAFDEKAFRLGIERVSKPEGVLHALFEARSRFLYAGLTDTEITSYISGVLIGEEVRSMREQYSTVNSLLLVCSESLRSPYSIAMKAFGITANWIDSDLATLAGILEIHQSIP